MAENSVDTPTPAWEEMEVDRKLPRIFLYGGQRELREKGETYLPKYEGEDGTAAQPKSEYGSRLLRTFLVNFYKDAIINLVGRVFAEPLIFSQDTPPQILALWENIDDCGTHGDIFVQRVARDALGQGISHVLVDYQNPDQDFPNRPAETRAGMRPKWVHYKAEDVIEALGQIINGSPFLQRTRIREQAEQVKEGKEFSYETVRYVREYRMGDLFATDETRFFEFRLWTYNEATETWVSGGWERTAPARTAADPSMFSEPSLVPFYGEYEDFFRGSVPLLGMSDLNLQHYQLKSNIDNMEYTATVPTLLEIGNDENDSIEVGAGRVIRLPEGCSLSWLEIEGKGLQQAKDSLRHLEEHIRLAGREPMVKKATGSELATVRMLDEAQHLTLAQAWALSWVQSVNRCLDLTAGWLGLPTAGTVRIDQSVLESLAQPDSFEHIQEMAALGYLSKRDLLEEARRYGVLDREFDIDKALDNIAAEEPRALKPPVAKPFEEVE